MTTLCVVCHRDPKHMNSAVTECSHVDCPHRGRAWSDRPTREDLFRGPWPTNADHDPLPVDEDLKGKP